MAPSPDSNEQLGSVAGFVCAARRGAPCPSVVPPRACRSLSVPFLPSLPGGSVLRSLLTPLPVSVLWTLDRGGPAVLGGLRHTAAPRCLPPLLCRVALWLQEDLPGVLIWSLSGAGRSVSPRSADGVTLV